MGITGVLNNVATLLHIIEALRSVVAAKFEAEKETKGLDRLPPTAQSVILDASATSRTSIPTSPPPTIHRFFNARNATSLQTNCSLTYAGKKKHFPTSFCQALLQGNILAIPRPDAPTVKLPLLIPPCSAGPAFPPVHGTGLPIKRRGRRATGPEGPCPQVNT